MQGIFLIALLFIALMCNTNSFQVKTKRTATSTKLSMNLMRFVKVSFATTALTIALGADFTFNGDQMLSMTPIPVHARGILP